MNKLLALGAALLVTATATAAVKPVEFFNMVDSEVAANKMTTADAQTAVLSYCTGVMFSVELNQETLKSHAPALATDDVLADFPQVVPAVEAKMKTWIDQQSKVGFNDVSYNVGLEYAETVEVGHNKAESDPQYVSLESYINDSGTCASILMNYTPLMEFTFEVHEMIKAAKVGGI